MPGGAIKANFPERGGRENLIGHYSGEKKGCLALD